MIVAAGSGLTEVASLLGEARAADIGPFEHAVARSATAHTNTKPRIPNLYTGQRVRVPIG